MDQMNWYSEIIRPTWAPPGWIFSPVWTILYILIAISFTKVFWMYYKKQISFTVVIPFILNLIFNFLFTPIQFWLQNNTLALIDVTLVLITLIWAMKVIYRHNRWICYIQVPYLLWVSFATILQATITYLNF